MSAADVDVISIGILSRLSTTDIPALKSPSSTSTNIEDIVELSLALPGETLIGLNELKWDKPLGHGSFGLVIKAKWKTGWFTSREVAVKMLSNSTIDGIKHEVLF